MSMKSHPHNPDGAALSGITAEHIPHRRSECVDTRPTALLGPRRTFATRHALRCAWLRRENPCFRRRNTWFSARNTCAEAQNTCVKTQNTCAEVQNTCAETRNTCAKVQNTCAETQNTCEKVQNTCAEARNTYAKRQKSAPGRPGTRSQARCACRRFHRIGAEARKRRENSLIIGTRDRGPRARRPLPLRAEVRSC